MNNSKLATFLNKPVDIAPLVTFRVAFASFLLGDIYRYYKNDWIQSLFATPEFLFKYYNFS